MRKIIVWLIVAMMLGMQAPTACVNDAQTDWGGAHGNVNKNLILGTQKGLLPHEVRVFLASLRAVACHAEVVIFSAEKGGRADLEDLAETFGARIIEYDFERLSAQYGPMNLHRFHLFQEFLRRAGPNAYAQVLMCDIRDVFFQLDPFDALAVSEGLGVAIEPRHLSIAACDIHARWLSDECVDYKVYVHPIKPRTGPRIVPRVGDLYRFPTARTKKLLLHTPALPPTNTHETLTAYNTSRQKECSRLSATRAAHAPAPLLANRQLCMNTAA